MRRSRLFTRVLLALVALFGCAAALSAVLAARTLADMLERQYRSKAAAIAETIAGASVDDLLINKDLATLQALVDQFALTEGVAYILVREPSGNAIAHTFAPEVPAELLAIAMSNTRTAQAIRFAGSSFLDISAPILDGELGQVHVGMEQAAIDAAFWRAMRRQAVVIGLLGVLAVVAAYFLVKRITQPLSRFAGHARKVAALESLFDSLTPVAEDLAPIATRTDEVGQLARSLAQMIQAVAAREQRLKWAEESIRRSEQYYRSLIENVSDVIILLDGVGNTRYVSPSLAELIGCGPADWLERDISLLVHPDDREAFRQAISSCLARQAPGQPLTTPGEGASVEVRMVRLDGTIRMVDASFTNLLYDPAVVGVVGTLRDISDRKRTQELTHAREQAEEASRLKSQLLANISHEFYTPMHHILGLTEMTLETEVNEEQRENLQMLRTSAGDLMAILQNILDFSSLESGKLRLEEAPFGLSELLHDIFALLDPVARQKGLRLDAEVSPEVPEVLLGDVDRLRQVLLQVVGNGLKFTREGEVVVRAELVGMSLVRFSVRDTGIGVPVDKQRQIFDPFVQGDGSSKRHFGGTGLGLAIARSLVERMGGEIWLESEIGNGSVFRFTLPLRTTG